MTKEITSQWQMDMKQAKLRVIEGEYYQNGQELWVHPYTSNSIKMWVSDDIKKGNYRIGVIVDGWFNVCYVGRATDQTLQSRMLQHQEYEDDIYYFDFNAADTDKQAIEKECIDFHTFGGDDWLDNEYHPALPEGMECPWEECNHKGS